MAGVSRARPGTDGADEARQQGEPTPPAAASARPSMVFTL